MSFGYVSFQGSCTGGSNLENKPFQPSPRYKPQGIYWTLPGRVTERERETSQRSSPSTLHRCQQNICSAQEKRVYMCACVWSGSSPFYVFAITSSSPMSRKARNTAGTAWRHSCNATPGNKGWRVSVDVSIPDYIPGYLIPHNLANGSLLWTSSLGLPCSRSLPQRIVKEYGKKTLTNNKTYNPSSLLCCIFKRFDPSMNFFDFPLSNNRWKDEIFFYPMEKYLGEYWKTLTHLEDWTVTSIFDFQKRRVD